MFWDLLLVRLLDESDADGVWWAALVEFHMLYDLVVRRLEHVLGESVMTAIRIVGVRHAFDLAQLAHRLSVRIPPDGHRRRVVREFTLLLDRLGLIVWNIIKRVHVEIAVVVHKLICHSVYRLNQIQSLVFGEWVSLRSVPLLVSCLMVLGGLVWWRQLIVVTLFLMIVRFIFIISRSWLVLEYSIAIVCIIVICIRIRSFAASVEIVSMSSLIQ